MAKCDGCGEFVASLIDEGLKTPSGIALLAIIFLGLCFLIYSLYAQSKKPTENPDEITENDLKFPRL
jgi:hypothetical protein